MINIQRSKINLFIKKIDQIIERHLESRIIVERLEDEEESIDDTKSNQAKKSTESVKTTRSTRATTRQETNTLAR